MRASPLVIAVTATIVFVCTLGLLLVVGGFGLIRLIEQMAEALGMLPTRWGEANLLILVEIAAALSAPIVLWSAVWFFRKARAAELRMVEYDAEKRSAGTI